MPDWNGIVDHGCTVGGCRDNDIRIIGGVTLCLFLLLTIAGMDWVTRVQKFLLVLLIFAQTDMFLGNILESRRSYQTTNARSEACIWVYRLES